MVDCVFCDGEFKYSSIKEYSKWDLQLFVDDQYYIGRTVAVLRSRHIENIQKLNKEEREELFNKVLPEINSSLERIFSPDLFNYSSLGNDCRHLHVHIIPRYKEPIKFSEETFIDEFWNEHYVQDYERVKLDNDKINDLIKLIRNNIGNS